MDAAEDREGLRKGRIEETDKTRARVSLLRKGKEWNPQCGRRKHDKPLRTGDEKGTQKEDGIIPRAPVIDDDKKKGGSQALPRGGLKRGWWDLSTMEKAIQKVRLFPGGRRTKGAQV